MLEFAQKGFWVVLPYKLMKDFEKLRLSPLGVVPQQNRCPHLIVDYTYYNVNQEMVILSPKEVMHFGQALERILYHIRHANPHYGVVYLGKVDLADGFYQVWVAAGDIASLGVVLPRYADEDQLVAFPLTLTMGWVESPLYFCAFTETVANIAKALPKNVDLPKHLLEHLANTKPSDEDIMAASEVSSRPSVRPIAASEVSLRPSVCPIAASEVSFRPSVHPIATSEVSLRPSVHPIAASEVSLRPAVRPLAASAISLRPSVCPIAASAISLRPAVRTLGVISPPGPVTPPQPAQPVLHPYQHPLDHHDMYVDDFCSAVQGNHRCRVQHQRRLLHSIDAVF
jgi:hypothetical protein